MYIGKQEKHTRELKKQQQKTCFCFPEKEELPLANTHKHALTPTCWVLRNHWDQHRNPEKALSLLRGQEFLGSSVTNGTEGFCGSEPWSEQVAPLRECYLWPLIMVCSAASLCVCFALGSLSWAENQTLPCPGPAPLPGSFLSVLHHLPTASFGDICFLAHFQVWLPWPGPVCIN